jgi:hypothetical protein
LQGPSSITPQFTNLAWQVSPGGQHVRLNPGDSETILVPPPKDGSSWRVSLWIGSDESLVGRVLRETSDNIGLERRPKVVHAFQSDWITQ